MALGALSLGVLGLRAQSSAPATIAVSRHALSNNGRIEGSAQQLLGENLNLNNGAYFGGDLRVPGNPRVQLNGQPNWNGQSNGGGSSSPSNYTVTINGGVTLRSLVKQSDPIALDSVATPPNPSGNRSVSVNNAPDVAAIGAWSSVKNLNVNGGNLNIAVPAGTYGNFNLNGGALVLGTPNDTSPDVYNFQNLSVNSGAQLKCVGPVVVNVRNSPNVNGILGSSQNQSWLRLNISNGGLNLNSNAIIYGAVRAPSGNVQINGVVWGNVQADRLTVNNGGAIKSAAIVEPTPVPTLIPTPTPTATPTPSPTATPVPTAIPTPTPTGAPLATVSPIVECVDNLGGGQYRAHFGTNVPGTQTQIIPIGETAGNENKFTPSPIDRDQPTSFLPGRTRDSFTVDFNGSNLTWTLRGHTATASANSNGCPTPTPTPTVEPTATPVPEPTATPTPIPNRAPVAANDLYSVDEDGTLTVATPGALANDSDADGDNFEAQLVAGPAHGTLELFLNGGFSYLPAADYNGADSFTYRANDGALTSEIATVSLTINAVNDAPVAADVNADSVNHSDLLTGTLSATDVDNATSTLSFALVDAPAHGTATVNADGTFSYRATPGTFYSGPDSFTYRATDASGLNSNLATVRVNVTAPPAPIARDDEYSMSDAANAPLNSQSVLLNDSGAGALTARLVKTTANGALTLNADGTFSYKRNLGFVGDDNFTYSAVSAQGVVSSVATATIHVTHVSRGIYANSDIYSVGANGILRVPAPGVLGNDYDLDTAEYGDRFGDKLTVSLLLTEPPHHGTVALRADGSFDYQLNAPVPTQNVTDGFYYRISDGQGGQSIGRVSIAIQPNNNAPIAQGQLVRLNGANSLPITLSGSDADGDALTYQMLTLPAQGTLRSASSGIPLYVDRFVEPQDVVYESTNAGASATDSFTFRVRDARGAYSDGATVSIRLTPNRAPVAVFDEIKTSKFEVSVPVTLNDTDADGDSLRVVFLNPSQSGATVTISSDGKSVLYKFNGPTLPAYDWFSYGVADPDGATSYSYVSLIFVAPAKPDALINALAQNDIRLGAGIFNLDGSGQTTTNTTRRLASASGPAIAAYNVVLANASQTSDQLVLRGPAFEPGATAQTAHWRLRYFAFSNSQLEITDAVTSARGWTTPNGVASGSNVFVRVEISADDTVPGDTVLPTLFEVSSQREPGARDVVGALTSSPPNPNQLLRNGKFTENLAGANLPRYWLPSIENGSLAKFGLQAEGAYSAPASLLISVKSGTARIEQDLLALPQTPLTFSGYAKGIKPGQIVKGIVQMFDNSGNGPTVTPFVSIGASTDWQRFARPLYIPAGTTRARLIFEVHGEGDVLLDDISILPTKPGDFPAQGQG